MKGVGWAPAIGPVPRYKYGRPETPGRLVKIGPKGTFGGKTNVDPVMGVGLAAGQKKTLFIPLTKKGDWEVGQITKQAQKGYSLHLLLLLLQTKQMVCRF